MAADDDGPLTPPDGVPPMRRGDGDGDDVVIMFVIEDNDDVVGVRVE